MGLMRRLRASFCRDQSHISGLLAGNEEMGSEDWFQLKSFVYARRKTGKSKYCLGLLRRVLPLLYVRALV